MTRLAVSAMPSMRRRWSFFNPQAKHPAFHGVSGSGVADPLMSQTEFPMPHTPLDDALLTLDAAVTAVVAPTRQSEKARRARAALLRVRAVGQRMALQMLVYMPHQGPVDPEEMLNRYLDSGGNMVDLREAFNTVRERRI